MVRKKKKKKKYKLKGEKKKKKKGEKKFPPKQCIECQSDNIYYNKSNDNVYCRECGAIMTRS